MARNGLPQGFSDRNLLVDLKFAITKILSDRSKATGSALAAPSSILGTIVQRGNVVVTSNWDLLVERAAELRGVPLRLSGSPSDASLTLLKLHGSID